MLSSAKNIIENVPFASPNFERFTLAIHAFCLCCGQRMILKSATQRYCSDSCKSSYQSKIANYRKKLRSIAYKTEVREITKMECPRCREPGYLVEYSMKNRKKGNVVSIYETIRHQVMMENGKLILQKQCYIRSVPICPQ